MTPSPPPSSPMWPLGLFPRGAQEGWGETAEAALWAQSESSLRSPVPLNLHHTGQSLTPEPHSKMEEAAGKHHPGREQRCGSESPHHRMSASFPIAGHGGGVGRAGKRPAGAPGLELRQGPRPRPVPVTFSSQTGSRHGGAEEGRSQHCSRASHQAPPRSVTRSQVCGTMMQQRPHCFLLPETLLI